MKRYDDKKMKRYDDKKLEEKESGYKGSFYIEEKKDGGFVVYIASGGSKQPEFYKEVKDKKEALKEFKDVLTRASKGYKQI